MIFLRRFIVGFGFAWFVWNSILWASTEIYVGVDQTRIIAIPAHADSINPLISAGGIGPCLGIAGMNRADGHRIAFVTHVLYFPGQPEKSFEHAKTMIRSLANQLGDRGVKISDFDMVIVGGGFNAGYFDFGGQVKTFLEKKYSAHLRPQNVQIGGSFIRTITVLPERIALDHQSTQI